MKKRIKIKNNKRDMTIKEKIEEVLRNCVLDITDEYKGRKQEQGVSVFLGYPVKIIDELSELFEKEIKF